ncbi:hypothetical protein PHYPO_G00138070 [Pangasianodon hypophthalmus]|uniref:Uncharacterized protein n=1 Tax=Pangasianodon hypophthalmus TaxID=310915 RepID=A0A5N5KD23_PANHP|nr:hypothetical protein PHYPO_G00138070 [Pangasianodon hypophthalmus]
MDHRSQSPSSENKENPQAVTHNPSDQASRESDHAGTPSASCESSGRRFRSVEEAREKLKFILGASEDNSSDDEASTSAKSHIRRGSDAPEATLQDTGASQTTSMR